MMQTAEALHEKLKEVQGEGALCHYDLEHCRTLLPLIQEIEELKRAKNAVILAHSYVRPEIVYGVADFTGDSYGLSKDATRTHADIIVFAAVKFMGETAKILNPDKTVLIPSELNGCTLADSITGDEVKRLKAEFPAHTFVCYINTTADVKAECDVCVTSSNVYKIVENLPSDKIFFLPDKLMGKNLVEEMTRRGVQKEILYSDGTCYVHEQYEPGMIDLLRARHPGLEVVAHPECTPEVVAQSDYVGSTSNMMEHVAKSAKRDFLMLTECGLTSRLQVEYPQKRFVGSCSQCRYMKSNTLEDILRVLKEPRPQDVVVLEETVRQKALGCIEAMFRYAEAPTPINGDC